MRNIGKNIRDLRIAKGITQDVLAEKLFVTRQTVSNYENGKSRPDVDMLAQISEVLECEVNEIIYGISKNTYKNQEYVKLAVGAVLFFLIVALYKLVYPIAYHIKGTYYLAAPSFLVQLTLIPLTWIVVGWTIMQLAGTAFKTRIAIPAWVKYVRYILVVFIIVYFAGVIITLLPKSIENLFFLKQMKAGIFTEYVSSIPIWFTDLSERILSNLIYLFVFPKKLITPIFLSLGILLWLCGFPKIKCHHS